MKAGTSGKVIVVCGPTATGKSALAIEVAKRFGGEVVSADSRQVYKGLDVGSAKVTPAEMDGVPHHLIDVANPRDAAAPFTVADFKRLGNRAIAEIRSRGKVPIICGGTGLYIASLTDLAGFPSVPPDTDLRNRLANRPAEELFAMLRTIDPERARTIDSKNPVRLIRAIEVAQTLGAVPPRNQQTAEQGTDAEPGHLLFIGLTLPEDELREAIRRRISARIPAIFEEIRRLHENGVSFKRLDSFGLEYRYGAEYVRGAIPLETFRETLATKTWQYVRRQRTWFRRDRRIRWYHPVADHEKILAEVEDFLGDPDA